MTSNQALARPQSAACGFRIDNRIARVSDEDWQFIFTAVEAGWTTTRIMDEVDCSPSSVFVIARYARQEMRQRFKVCEHCRREIATGKKHADADSKHG